MAFDENGERHRRRQFDGWKLLPLGGTFVVAIFSWGISVENRLSNVSATQQERGPMLRQMKDDLGELSLLVHDPSTKPETKKEITQLWTDHDRLGAKIDRLEERFNNFHQFLLQTKQPVVPPSKRGALPFKLDDQG